MPPRRGRPPVTSPRQIALCAYDLFLRNGFEATTFEDIADALGVSRRTLFHYYASKELIVWYDHDATLATLRTALRASGSEVPVFTATRAAVVSTMSVPPERYPELRQRFLLIDATPKLRASSVFDDWRAVLASDAARRLRTKPDALRPQLLAMATQSVTMAALTSWAKARRGAPHEQVDQALATLGRGLETIDGTAIERPRRHR